MRMAGYVPCGKVAVKGAAGPGSGAREVSGEVVGPDRTCVIGAGPSGLAAVKALAEAGLDFDCFEKSDRVGGNWVFGNRNGQSRIYRALHINTSRQRMAYADFPMPADYPDFPHHALMARYFEAYVAAFGLHRRITFGTAVMRAEREEPGRWQLTLADGTIRCYRALVVANGHHWDPRWPEPPVPGPFAGEIIHAHDYVAPDEPIDFAGKRVVVVGMGNSAMDIACELSRPGIAERLYLSARRGAWVIPNYVMGRPMDRLGVGAAWLPWRVQSLMAELLIRLVVGAPWRFGLPRPDHPPGRPPDRQPGPARPPGPRRRRAQARDPRAAGQERAVRRRQHGRGRRIGLLHRLPAELPVLPTGVPGRARQRAAVVAPPAATWRGRPVLRRPAAARGSGDADCGGTGQADRGVPRRPLPTAVD